jgi:homoserine dehydrogenase
MAVHDKPGVLANVANVFAKEDVSIQTVLQKGRGDAAELTVVTHRATEANLAATVAALSKSDVVREVESVIRVEGSAS